MIENDNFPRNLFSRTMIPEFDMLKTINFSKNVTFIWELLSFNNENVISVNIGKKVTSLCVATLSCLFA